MKEDIQNVIENTIREQLSDAVIDRITVQEDIDHDGDEILRVLVIFDAEKGGHDSNKTVSMVRHVREKLHELKEDRFPIISYVSTSDAKRMTPAAA